MRIQILLTALTLALIPVAHAANTSTRPAQPVVQGTQQLDGQNARVGQTFTLGKGSPLNFTLRSAEYSAGRVVIGGEVYYPKADEKLLILHYTVQNPQKGAARYYWADLKFTAVDAQDRNHEFIQAVAREGTTDKLEINLKPAQKVDVMTAIVVPAAGPVPKLIVQRESGTPVLRYDLRTQARGLPAPFADQSGTTALAQVPAAKGKFVTLKWYDVRLDDAKFTTETLGGQAPGAGKRYLTATFTLKNNLGRDTTFSWSDLKPTLKDADGERVEYNQTMLKASRDEKAGGALPKGEEARVRFFFELPSNVAGDSVLLTDESGRTFVFDVKDSK
ncbi:hypothetical protein [Deinococcus humi]|uniref:DUF4352 domain-containing protein n=1 Tax=Deinococcus humi TaxID=662880 RepID=A0A7W8JUE7_9DEIO|nr:hypothetical protein [Deinococcus humi]MBB5363457.1 hypothetical protein [Deinococcus humi]GGO26400.1 hypothetical protein GCM10008949_17150 [Deinococcus humi]